MIEYEQIKKLPEEYIIKKINEFLAEDMPDGDATTNAIFSNTLNNPQPTTHNSITAFLQAEEDLIFAGEQTLEYFFDGNSQIDLKFKDGDKVKNGEIIAVIKGRTDIILSHERVMLNLLQRLCGIATLTNKYAEIAKPYNVKILDTRKTTPGLRLFEKYAVTVGGGFNHRLDLSSGILIKDNHIKAAGGIKQAIEMLRNNNPKNLKIEIEVENKEEINEALEIGVDGFLLDNMSPSTISKMVEYIRDNAGEDVFIEASGGINLSNLGEYVKTGVNAISSGALTHSVKGSNIHLEFSRF
ncbi:MAG: carboxylating nicotinate-nucleotide diphosphorylase [bacterium]